VDFVIALLRNALGQTLVSLSHNWPYLLGSILVAGILKVYVDADKVASFLGRHRGASVLTATAAAVATPFCSCGTTAVVLGMMASNIPWAPIVAFMVASPLSSPEGLIYSAGLFGWPFAAAYFAASILLGLVGGALASALQKAGFLDNQQRLAATDRASSAAACSCASAADAAPERRRPPLFERAAELGRAALDVAKTILPMFVGFAFLGFLLNGLIPAGAIGALFGSGRAYGVPLAATIGLPLYVNSEASMPLVRALLDSGMSRGAIMAFLIAGSGTSVGAIGGALTIARWRVVGLVVAVLLIGAIAAGYCYNGLLAAGAL
jgi:uncharacterized protein